MFIFLVPQYEQTKIKEMEIELIKKTLESKRDINGAVKLYAKALEKDNRFAIARESLA